MPLATKPCPAEAVAHSRVEGSKEELALTHSFIAVDRPALGEVWGGTDVKNQTAEKRCGLIWARCMQGMSYPLERKYWAVSPSLVSHPNFVSSFPLSCGQIPSLSLDTLSQLLTRLQLSLWSKWWGKSDWTHKAEASVGQQSEKWTSRSHSCTM